MSVPARDFLQEVPELRRFQDEPLLRPGLASGDALRLHAGLRRWRKQNPRYPERWVDDLLSNRRFFLTPAKPGVMRTVNGFGTRLCFRSEVNPRDGSYIATLCLVALFIPVFPLSQYLVSSAGKAGWRFFGKVPLSDGMRLWRRAVGAAALLALLLGAAVGGHGLYTRAQSTPVQVLNGLSVPVRVRVDRESLVIPAEGHTQLKVTPGAHRFRAEKLSGELLEEKTGQAPRWADLVAFNVLGAAPAYVETVTYSASGNVPGRLTPVAGESLLVRDDMAYVFAEPPEHLQVDAGSSRSVDAFGMSRGGWQSATRMLASHERIEDAAALARRVLLADTDDADARSQAVELTHRAGGNEALLALATQWIHHDPEDGGAQFLYVDALRGLGRGPEAIAFATERLNALPDSTQFAELVARAEDPAAALRRYEALVKQLPAGDSPSPAEVGMRRGLAMRLLFAHRAVEALQQFAWLQKHDVRYAQLLVPHARALLLLERPDWACALLEAWAPRSAPPRWDATVLHAQLRSRWPRGCTQPGGFLVNRLLSEAKLGPREFLETTLAVETGAADASSALKGNKVPPDKAAMLEIRVALGTDAEPTAALLHASRAPERVLAQLDDPSLLRLALSARLRGDAALAQRLLHADSDMRVDPEAALRYVRSGEHAERLLEWPLETQSVLQHARAQQLQATNPAAARALLMTADAGVVRPGH